jgi:hypothetical protein
VSHAGHGLAHLLSTLIVCGLASLIPTPAASPHGVFNAAFAFACDTSRDTSGGQEWSTRALETDPDLSDDDDDDDGPDDSDSAVSAGSCGADLLQTDLLFHFQFSASLSSVARDGHSLRAPPR